MFFALINTLKNDEMVKDASDSNNAAQNTDYAGLAACLNTAYKNHNLISGKLYTTKYERPVMTALFYGSKNMLK